MQTMTPVDRYVVIGNPISHSRSPSIHAAFARQTGEAIDYQRLESPLDGFARTVQALAAGGARGCNVTVPFKFEARALGQKVSDRARLAGAANVMRFDADGWFVDNSDGIGLVRDIEQGAGQPLAGRRVLLIGAGGGASGVLGPLIAAAPAELVVANRTAAKADALVGQHAEVAEAHRVRLAARPLDAPGRDFDIVINSSASSLAGAGIPVGPAVLARDALAVDLMYGPAAWPFIAWAEEHGARGRDGLGMLVEQAAEAFWIWRGKRPETAPVLADLRERISAGR